MEKREEEQMTTNRRTRVEDRLMIAKKDREQKKLGKSAPKGED